MEWVHGPVSSAVSGALAPPTQAQRVGRDMPGPQGGTMRLAVRTRQCLKCLAGQKSAIDRARLARLNLPPTNDPVVDRLLDAAATEIETRSGAGGGTGGSTNPSGTNGPGTNEAEMILGLLTGTNDQAANDLRQAQCQAQRQPAAQAQTASGHGG